MGPWPRTTGSENVTTMVDNRRGTVVPAAGEDDTTTGATVSADRHVHGDATSMPTNTLGVGMAVSRMRPVGSTHVYCAPDVTNAAVSSTSTCRVEPAPAVAPAVTHTRAVSFTAAYCTAPVSRLVTVAYKSAAPPGGVSSTTSSNCADSVNVAAARMGTPCAPLAGTRVTTTGGKVSGTVENDHCSSCSTLPAKSATEPGMSDKDTLNVVSYRRRAAAGNNTVTSAPRTTTADVSNMDSVATVSPAVTSSTTTEPPTAATDSVNRIDSVVRPNTTAGDKWAGDNDNTSGASPSVMRKDHVRLLVMPGKALPFASRTMPASMRMWYVAPSSDSAPAGSGMYSCDPTTHMADAGMAAVVNTPTVRTTRAVPNDVGDRTTGSSNVTTAVDSWLPTGEPPDSGLNATTAGAWVSTTVVNCHASSVTPPNVAPGAPNVATMSLPNVTRNVVSCCATTSAGNGTCSWEHDTVSDAPGTTTASVGAVGDDGSEALARCIRHTDTSPTAPSTN